MYHDQDRASFGVGAGSLLIHWDDFSLESWYLVPSSTHPWYGGTLGALSCCECMSLTKNSGVMCQAVLPINTSEE